MGGFLKKLICEVEGVEDDGPGVRLDTVRGRPLRGKQHLCCLSFSVVIDLNQLPLDVAVAFDSREFLAWKSYTTGELRMLRKMIGAVRAEVGMGTMMFKISVWPSSVSQQINRGIERRRHHKGRLLSYSCF